MQMEEQHDRLRKARMGAGLKSAAIAAEKHHWNYPTYAGHENGSRGFRSETAQTYAKAFKVPLEWLITGDGDLRPVNGDDAHDGDALVPVYDVQASAGFGSLVDYEEQTHSLAFPPDYLKKLTSSSAKNLVIISTSGDSMEPTLLDHDIVLIDTSKTHLGYEGMFVLRHNDTLLVKRAGMAATAGNVTLLSDNKAYPPVEAQLADLHVVGKVLWYGRKV